MCAPVIGAIGSLIAAKKASSVPTPPAPDPVPAAPTPQDQSTAADAAVAAKDKEKKRQAAAMNYAATQTGASGSSGAVATNKLLGGSNEKLG